MQDSNDGPAQRGQGSAVEKSTDGAGKGGHKAQADRSAREEENAEDWDVTAGMNPRQKKLYLLQQKAAKARKANEHAAVIEAKRVRAGPPDSNLERKKWLDKQKKEKEVWPIHPVVWCVYFVHVHKFMCITSSASVTLPDSILVDERFVSRYWSPVSSYISFIMQGSVISSLTV